MKSSLVRKVCKKHDDAPKERYVFSRIGIQTLYSQMGMYKHFVHMHVCVYACVYVSIYVTVWIGTPSRVSLYACKYMCIYIYVSVYINMYMYIK